MEPLENETNGRVEIQEATAHRQLHIVDFVCFENRIIIEVDGGQHAAENNKDRERDTYLQRYGFKILRFWSNEVLQNINGVLAVI